MKLTELVSFKTNLTEARGPMCWVVLGPDFKKDRTESQVFTKLDALCKEPQKFVSFEASTAVSCLG